MVEVLPFQPAPDPQERRRSSKSLSREMYTRALGWSTIELAAVLDIVASRLVLDDPTHGVDLVLQQVANALRKKPTGRPEAPATAAPAIPEAGAAVPSDGAGCPPQFEDDFVDDPSKGFREPSLLDGARLLTGMHPAWPEKLGGDA